jgi:type VI protein secretion system component VasK
MRINRTFYSPYERDMSVDEFVIGVIFLAIWIWAITVLIQKYDTLPTWAKVIGIICATNPAFSVITLIIVYSAKK